MKKKNQVHGRPEQTAGLRSIKPVQTDLKPPLSRLQHAIAGAVILLLLIMLTVAAIAINNWRRQNELDFRGGTSDTQAENPGTSPDADRDYDKAIRTGDPDQVPATARMRDHLIVGVDESIDIINPLYSVSDGEKDLVSLIFEPLLRFSATGEPQGVLARSWQYDANSRQLVFSLQPGHFFYDGRAVESADVVYTYQCLLSESYNGPYKGRFHDIVAVETGQDETEIVFRLAENSSGPDLSLFTIGILKYDYYAYELDKVFMMAQERLPPQGSGVYYYLRGSGDSVAIALRPGYAGEISRIEFRRIASEEKLDQLLGGQIDLVRNRWDTRMQIRADALPAYSFYPSSTRIDAYLMVGREPSAPSPLQNPDLRRDILLAASGFALPEDRLKQLSSLDAPVECLYFIGVDDHIRTRNLDSLRTITLSLSQLGMTIEPMGVDWPEMAAQAESGSYELMLMPAPSNNRLPEGTVLLDPEAGDSGKYANAWAAIWHDEVIIASARLRQLTINEYGFPLSISTVSWTDRLENVRLHTYD